jgi:ComF family protein
MLRARVSRESVWAALRTATDALASVVFPAPCRICTATLDTASRVPVCARCLASFELITGPVCACCGRPIISPVVADSIQILCRLCRAGTYGFDNSRSYALYNTPMVRAILLLKHEAVAPLGAWFAGRLAEVIARMPECIRADVVVPVPLHPARLRERGFNQAELIARPLAKQLRLKFKSFLLVRTKPRPDKLRLTRHERWTTVRGAYEAREGVRVDNLHVLLVDDVMATGATLDACSRALRKAGAARVTAVTVARSVPNWSSADGAREQPGVPPF